MSLILATTCIQNSMNAFLSGIEYVFFIIFSHSISSPLWIQIRLFNAIAELLNDTLEWIMKNHFLHSSFKSIGLWTFEAIRLDIIQSKWSLCFQRQKWIITTWMGFWCIKLPVHWLELKCRSTEMVLSKFDYEMVRKMKTSHSILWCVWDKYWESFRIYIINI